MITTKDRHILRDLAKVQMELAADDKNKERIRRIREMHNLKPVRPPVWIDEIPWHEMDIDGQLVLHCETDEAKSIEEKFRRTLFRWNHLQADMVVEDVFYIEKAFKSSGIGVEIKENVLSIDRKNNIVSHQYEDQLDTEEKLDAIRMPTIQALPEIDRKNVEMLESIFGDIIPVKLRGYGIMYSPWDTIATLRGVENILFDMMDRPEFLHKIIRKFTDVNLSKFDQMEYQGLLDFNIQTLHCTPPYTDDLPAEDYDGGIIRLKDIWFRGAAQMFSATSPDMQDEFDLQYMRKVMDKCALSYYGCCEPLDKFIPYLKKVPNLRKIGVSPWADVQSSAEQIGGNYVLARKPNPALVAGKLNHDVVKQEIVETIEVCLQNKCPYEFVLKDISTVGYRPQNLIEWTHIVMDTINDYYA
jgi:hypothetical protein